MKRLRVLVVVLLSVGMLTVPAVTAEENAPPNIPVPSTQTLDPLPDMVGEPAPFTDGASTTAAMATEDPDPRMFGDAELHGTQLDSWGAVRQIVHDPDTSRVHVLIGNMNIETRGGTTLAPLGSRFWGREIEWMTAGGGYLFIVDSQEFTQFDSAGNATRSIQVDNPGPMRPVVSGGSLWYGTAPDLKAMDIETGVVTNHALPPGSSGVINPTAIPGRDDRLLVAANGLWLFDISGATPTVVADLSLYSNNIMDVTADGHLVYISGGNTFELSVDTGAVIAQINDSPSLWAGGNQTLWEANLALDIADTGISFHDAQSGDWVSSAGADRGQLDAVLATPDGTKAWVAGHNLETNRPNLVLLDLRPRMLSVDAPIYVPAKTTAILVNGVALGPDLQVKINGQLRSHRVVDTGGLDPQMLVEVSLNQHDRAHDAEIELTTSVGSTTHILPGSPPRGMAAVVVQLETSQSWNTLLNWYGGEVTFWLSCDGHSTPHSVPEHGTVTVLVPAHLDCRAASASSVKARFAILSDGPAIPPYDVAQEVSFVSGGTTYLGYTLGYNRIAHWVFVTERGGADDTTNYTVSLDCDTWSDSASTRGTSALRFEIPLGVFVAYENCSVSLAGAEGKPVTARDLQNFEAANSLNFTPNEQGGFTSFTVDHGGADTNFPLAVGAPGEGVGRASAAGSAHIYATTWPGHTSGPGSYMVVQGRHGLYGGPESNDNFGQAVTTGDYNDDGWTDVAVAAPGEGIGRKDNAGLVTIMFGSSNGYYGSDSQTLHQDTRGVPGLAESGDRFGQALATVDYNGDGIDDLAVGVPGEGIGRKNNAGLVHIFHGSAAGLEATGGEVITQGTQGIVSVVEANDEFGASLAGYRGHLAVGSPGEDIGSINEGGMVHLLHGPSYTSVATWQGTDLSDDTAEAGDRFGEVVALSGDTLVVGVPSEDLDGNVDAGLVQMYYYSQGPAEITNYSQTAQKWLRGVSEAGDRFGSSLSAVDAYSEGESTFILIGAPGEDGGKGKVNMVRKQWRYGGTRAWNNWSIGHAGDQFGAQVAFGPTGALVVTSPGYGNGAGAVLTSLDGVSWNTARQGVDGRPGAHEAGDQLGYSLGG